MGGISSKTCFKFVFHTSAQKKLKKEVNKYFLIVMSLCSHTLKSSSNCLVVNYNIQLGEPLGAQGSNDETRKWGKIDCQWAGCPGFLYI